MILVHLRFSVSLKQPFHRTLAFQLILFQLATQYLSYQTIRISFNCLFLIFVSILTSYNNSGASTTDDIQRFLLMQCYSNYFILSSATKLNQVFQIICTYLGKYNVESSGNLRCKETCQ